MSVRTGNPRRRRTARQMEIDAAARPARARVPPLAASEPVAMLVRRGFRPTPMRPDLPFPPDLPGEQLDRILDRLGHYGFRLFLRGAILKPDGFKPAEATRYLTPDRAEAAAEALVELGLAARGPRGRYRLLHPARSFGGTLEWYVGRELERRLGLQVATGLKFHQPGVGGDLDVVASAEGRLIYLELKSSPPKHLDGSEVAQFFARVEALRPDLALFVMDTTLRLTDRVLPVLSGELGRLRPDAPRPVRLQGRIWALLPRLYVVNANPDLLQNLGLALAEGFRALTPPLP